MNSLNRISIAAAVALALAGGSALAQTQRPITTTTNGPNLNGGCRSNGGSCTASNFQNSGTTTVGEAQSVTPGVSGANNATNGATPVNNNTSGGASVTGQTNVDPATTRPDPFGPGGAFDTSGTTSGAGTGSTSGSGVGSTNGNGNTNGTDNLGNALLPGSTGAVVLPTDANGNPVAGNPSTQQTVVVQQPQALQQRAATPLFDQVAREGRAKDARRRAQGNEPRVYGIAPRTDRDLTYQMPDDPIIRY
jgi:hypothetical protein